MVSDGYVGATDSSGFRSHNGWATVGDQGSLDARGFLVLAGRENEMLITGGFNVYPQEIEAVLDAVPGVTAAAVFGLPDARWGQIVVAVIEGEVPRSALIAACAVALPGYKRPRLWLKIAVMPRTASGKIARAQVLDMISGLQELS
jgi:long-chain acyl-CoA synthetase